MLAVKSPHRSLHGWATTGSRGQRTIRGLVSALLLALALTTPGPGRADDGAAAAAPLPAPAAAQVVVTPNYTVGPGDSIKMRVYEENRLNGTYVVSQDGRVDLPWVGKISVTGLSPDQIADLVESRYADGYLVSPQIVVEVGAYGSKPVQVLGNIENPGTYFLEGPTDLVGLLARAGGIAASDQLATYEVQIKRARTEAGAPINISLDRLLHLGEGNVKLEAGDIIHITRGRVVYVSGSVARPGSVAWKEGLTITQALVAAGGHARTANLRKVLIIRGSERISINLRDIQHGRANDVQIRPEDQIIIEESVF